MCILCPLSEIREEPVLNITLPGESEHEECGSGRAGAVVAEGVQWGVGHSSPTWPGSWPVPGPLRASHRVFAGGWES